MGEDDVEERLGQARIEAVDPLDLATHEVVAERDLALEAPGVREVDGERVIVVGHRLPDVVEQGAGHRDVAVHAREGRRGRADRLGDGDRVVD